MKITRLLLLLLLTFVLLSYHSTMSFTFSGGAPAGYSGAPYEFTCSDAPACHSGNSNITEGITIDLVEQSSGQSVTSYTNGLTYDVTISVSNPLASCFGFQSVILKDSDGWSSGDLIPGAGQETAGIMGGTSRFYVQHSTPSTTGEWTFQWLAPVSYEGTLTMYVSANAANCDYTSAGDQIIVETMTLEEFDCGVGAELLSDGGAISFNCNYDAVDPRLEFYLTGFSGSNPPFILSALNAEFGSSTAAIGDTVSVFVSQANLDEGDILLYVNDANSSCGPIDLGSIVAGFPINSLCNNPPVDTCDVTYDFVLDGSEPEILCADLGGQPALFIQLTNFSADAPPFIIDATAGILSSSTAMPGDTVILYVTQADIDGGSIDILVNDQDFNCTSNSIGAFFSGIDINDYCGLVVECEVSYTIAGDTNGIIDIEDISCSVDASGNYTASIDFENFAGDNPPFFFFPDGGFVNNTFINPGGTATYSFTQSDIDNNSVKFLIDNTNALCDTINLMPVLMGLSLEEICNPCNVEFMHSLSDPANLQLNCRAVGGVAFLDIEIFSLTGGTPPYSLSTTSGSLSSQSAITGETVTLSLTQAEIDANQVMLTVDDGSGSCEAVNVLEHLLIAYPNFQIIDDCTNFSCDILWNYAEDMDEALQITCLATDSVPLIGITLTNFSGSNPPFSLQADQGIFVPSSVDVGGTSTYYVSAGIANAGNAAFTVSSSMNSCELTNTSSFITEEIIQYCNDLVSVQNFDEQDLMIYPNPVSASGVINVSLEGTKQESILNLLNINGQMIYSDRFSGSEYELDISALGLSSGIYSIRITQDESYILKNIVVE